MTVLSAINKTIQSGNGSNKNFDFSFKIPVGIDSTYEYLSLTKRNADGSETTISSDFSVTGLGDAAGGTVTYPVIGSALTSSEKIVIKRVVPNKQREDFRNQGTYSLEDIEDALDYTIFCVQQLQEELDRSIKLNLSTLQTSKTVQDFIPNRILIVSADGASLEMSSLSIGDIQDELADILAIKDEILAVAAIDSEIVIVAGIDTEVTTVAGIAAAIATVATNAAAVATVATNIASVNTVATNIANINTVAGIAANVTTVAGIAANVTTVAGIAANVTTVAGMSASIASVIANMTAIQNAASFGFPTTSGSDAYKYLRVNSGGTGYDLVSLDYVALTDAATIALDMNTFINGAVTITASRILGNPTNTKNGQRGSIVITQGGSGSYALTFASNWKNTANVILSTAVGAKDIIYYDVIDSTNIVISGFIKGVA